MNHAPHRTDDTTRRNHETSPQFPTPGDNTRNTTHDLTTIWRADTLSAMAARVKAIQRESAETPDLWKKWCDYYGRGVRDPALHSREFLHYFLTT